MRQAECYFYHSNYMYNTSVFIQNFHSQLCCYILIPCIQSSFYFFSVRRMICSKLLYILCTLQMFQNTCNTNKIQMVWNKKYVSVYSSKFIICCFTQSVVLRYIYFCSCLTKVVAVLLWLTQTLLFLSLGVNSLQV